MHHFFDDPTQRHSRILLLPEPIVQQGGLWPVRLGQVFAKKNYYSQQQRSFEYFNFHFIKEGMLEMKFRDRREILQKYDLFCIFPNMPVEYYEVAVANQPPIMDWITFDGPQVPALLETLGISPQQPYLRNAITAELLHTLQAILQPPFQGLARHLEMQALLTRLFSQLLHGHRLPEQENDSTDPVTQSIQFMNMHFMEGISVQDVSDYVSLHRGYLSKIFTVKMGMPPMRYLEKLRMEKAAELLRSTSNPIHDIAYQLGFPDQYTFTHAFSRYFAIPPGKWRKRYLTKQQDINP